MSLQLHHQFKIASLMSEDLSNQSIPQIYMRDFVARCSDVKDALQLVDVREPEELEIAQLEGFINLPLSRYGEWSTKIREILDPHAETIVMCHHGMRSAQMCQWLMHQGFTDVKNLVGGIDEYSKIIDSSVSRY